MNLEEIPYDRTNPLSFWLNKPKGSCQVKDLPTDERDCFVKEFQEEQSIISKYVLEFDIKSSKTATKLEDMTHLEKQQWLSFLKHDNAEILNQFTEISTDINFFDEKFNEYQGYNEDIHIDTWEWNDIILTDIYGWPGDNQSGGVFVGMDLVFENSDTNLEFPKRIANDKYPMLNERKDALSHLKDRLFCIESCNHDHCNILSIKFDKF